MAIYGALKQIPPYDISRTTFNTYRQWNLKKQNFLSSSLESDDHITCLVAHKPNPALYSGGIVTYDSFQTVNEVKNTNTINNYVGEEYYATALWYSLNHLYYNDAYSYNSYTNTSYDTAVKNLYVTASIISIPQKYFGDTIKPGSVGITTNNPVTCNLVDDSYGNIIDQSLSGSVAKNNQKLYLGFNQYDFNTPSTFNLPFSNLTYIPNNIEYVTSDIYQLWSGGTGSIGLTAKFNGSNYLQIRENVANPFAAKTLSPEYNEEFAMSFWLFADSNIATNSSDYNYIVTKRREGLGYIQINNNVQYSEFDIDTIKFPYEIRISNSVSLVTSAILSALRSDGTNTIEVSSSILVGNQPGAYRDGLDRNAYHVLYQKTGNTLELYLDGVLVDSATDTTEFNFNNNSDLFIGNLGKNHGGFEGTIDEFLFFNRALNSTEIVQLSTPEYCTNTNVVGNVFYEHGIAVISDPRPKYNKLSYYCSSWNSAGPGAFITFDVNFKSKVPINEVEVLCRIREDEFTFSTNPTTLVDYRFPDVIGNVTSSFWTPYVTTIGLYNPNGELLAVGKLANPISKIKNADLNFIVRFDI